MHTDLRAGTAEVDITPPPDCDMIHRRAEGIHDPLRARVLAFADGEERVAIVGLDLIALSREQISQVRQRVRERCGLDSAGLLLCCSHTHSGPTTNYFRGWGRGDSAYIASLVEKVANTVASALQRLAPCRLRYGEAPLRVGFNRRVDHPDGAARMEPNRAAPVDRAVRVLCVDNAVTGELLGVLFSHGCHPVVLHINSKLVTSDYPGRAAKYIQAELGSDVCPVFALGCAGDTNSEVLNGTFADRERLGVLTGRAVLAAIRDAKPVTAGPLRAGLATIPLPVRMPTREEAKAALVQAEKQVAELRTSGAAAETIAEYQECAVEWAQDLCRVAAGVLPARLELDISAVSFGAEFGMIGVGAELFYGYQEICRALAPWAHTLVVSCTNGPVCYLPTAAEFARKGYETAGATYVDPMAYAYRRYGTLALTPDCEAAVRQAVAKTLAGLSQPRGSSGSAP